MASAGGHWVKATSGPYAGKFTFLPANKAKTVVHEGKTYVGIGQGSAFAFQNDSGKWEVAYQDKNGEWWSAGAYASKQLAVGKMTNMNAAGLGKALNENASYTTHKQITKVGAVVGKGGVPATAGGVKPGAKTSKLLVTEPGAKNIKAETAAAQAQAAAGKQFSTQGDFDANKQQVTITTLMGKQEQVEGVMVYDGSLGVTKNPKTGQYHMVDGVSGKTLGKYDTAEAAFAAAKQEQQSMVNYKAPANPNYKPFSSYHEAQSTMAAGYKNTHLTHDEIYAVGKFQGNSGYANDYLWSDQKNDFVSHMDGVMAKAKLPMNAQLVRGEGTGHPLYKLAKSLDVGDTYHAKGFDCTSINPSHEWGGNQVKLIYRAPKGIPAVFGWKYTGKFADEMEITLGRNLDWKVIGKTVHQGNITLTLDFEGYGIGDI